MNCHCGNTISFQNCCEPFIKQTSQPLNAEQLMRSRFSAYATNNAKYILFTYAKEKQIEHSLTDIEQWATENIWLNLAIHNTELNEPTSFVEFSAFYLHGTDVFELKENSRFMIEDGQWRYIDGNILRHDKIATVKRNDTCPCNSGQKFKKCCLK